MTDEARRFVGERSSRKSGIQSRKLNSPILIYIVPNGPDRLLSREQQENLREKLFGASPAELKVKIEHDADFPAEPAPIAAARSAEEKIRAHWAMKGSPPVDRQERLLAKLAEVEKTLLFSRES
jgi:hypothetical protein